MSAQVSLGWNNAELTAGAKRAENIVKHAAAQMSGALKGVASIDLGRLAGIGIAGYGFSQLASGIAEATLKADDNRQSMLAVEGSIEGVNQRLAVLREIARSPGLGFSQVVEADVKLRSVGMSAGESARAIEEIGNALALVGKGKADLDGVLLAFTQIISKGKISAEEINQIAERVPQIRAVLKGAFGTADSEQLQKLGIGVDEFVRRTLDGFSKLPRAIGGLRNSWENLGDTVSQAAASLGDAIVPELIPFMEDLATAIAKNGDVARSMGRFIADSGRLAADTFRQLKGAVDFVGGGMQGLLREVLVLTGAIDKSTPSFDAQAAAARRLANDQKLAAINAAGLARHERELQIATQRVADAQRRAADETDRYNRSLVQAAATRAQALTTLQEELRAESAKTRDLILNDDQRLADAKQKLLEIDRQLNAVAGQKNGEEITTKLYIEREKMMQRIIELQKRLGEQQRRDAEEAARAAGDAQRGREQAAQALSEAATTAGRRASGNPLVAGTRRQNETQADFRQRMDTGRAARTARPSSLAAWKASQGKPWGADALPETQWSRLQRTGFAWEKNLVPAGKQAPMQPVPAANQPPDGTPRDLIQVIELLPQGIARALLGQS